MTVWGKLSTYENINLLIWYSTFQIASCRTDISFQLHWHKDSLSNSLLICRTLGQSQRKRAHLWAPLGPHVRKIFFFFKNNAYALFRSVKFICGWDEVSCRKPIYLARRVHSHWILPKLFSPKSRSARFWTTGTIEFRKKSLSSY